MAANIYSASFDTPFCGLGNNLRANICAVQTPVTQLKTHVEPSIQFTSSLVLRLIVNVTRAGYANARWYWILYMFLLWEFRRLVWTLWWKAPVRLENPVGDQNLNSANHRHSAT